MTDTRSIITPSGQNDEEKQTNKKLTEQKQRDNEQFNRHCAMYAAWTAIRLGVEKFQPVENADERGNKINPADSQGEAGITISTPQSEILGDGRYMSNVGKSTWDIIVEDGKAQLSRQPRNDKEFTAMYGELMTFMAAAQGFGKGWDSPDGGTVGRGKLTIDWPQQKYVTSEYLEKLVRIATDKGIEVEFGPNVKKFLQSNQQEGFHYNQVDRTSTHTGREPEISTKDARVRYNYFNKLLEENQRAAQEKNNSPEFQKFQENFTLDKAKEKLQTRPYTPVGDAETYKATIDGKASNTEKLEQLEKDVEASAKAAKSLQDVHNTLENSIESLNRRVDQATDSQQVETAKQLFETSTKREQLIKIVEDHQEALANNITAIDSITPPNSLTSEENKRFDALKDRLNDAKETNEGIKTALTKTKSEVAGFTAKAEAKMESLAPAPEQQKGQQPQP